MTLRFVRWVAFFTLVVLLGACAARPPAPESMVPFASTAPATAAQHVDVAPTHDATPPANEPLIENVSASQGARSLSAFPVFSDPGEIPRLIIASDEPTKKTKDDESSRIPLTETRVVAKLSEFVAEVEVTQRYENKSDKTIEAIYDFPLPENAAVNRMKMVIGDREIEAKIDERQKARQTYEDAKKAGYSAALLEEERPNVFTQSVANIEPNKPIEVVVRYVQNLSYDAGVYEFVFPMVVGPRFMPGEATDATPKGSGTKADTTIVPDASRISPPYVGKGERSGRDISIEIIADPQLAIGAYEAITHDVKTEKLDSGELSIKLAKKDEIPNRDFVLRYQTASERPRGTLLLSDSESGFFSLIVDPPALPVDELVGRREIVFVVDVSGSMSGQPLALCKAAMQRSLSKLRPVDTFNVMTFSGATGKVFERPRPANDTNVRLAMDYVDNMVAGGGTMMLDAVAAALSPDVEKGRDRYVFFMTDGFVGDDDRIIASSRQFVRDMEAKGQRARVFGFGVGSSTNRSLIDGMSREGKGAPVYVTTREDPARAVNTFFRFIDRSVLRNVSIKWGDNTVSEVTPGELPDLFASHALIVHGRFSGGIGKAPVLVADAADGRIEIPVSVVKPARGRERAVLGTLWARAQIANLDVDYFSGDASAAQKITKLGLEFNLVTRFTSFVAVDTTRKVASGPAREQVVVPQEAPDGVDLDMAGGQKISLGPQPTQPEPPPRDVSDSSPRAYAPAEPPEAMRSERGCACSVPGHEDTSAPFGALAAALLAGLVVVARRRGRRQQRAR